MHARPYIISKYPVHRLSRVEFIPPHMGRSIVAGHLRQQAHHETSVLVEPAASIRRSLEACK